MNKFLADFEKKDKKFVQQLEKDFPGVKFVWDAPRFSYRMMTQKSDIQRMGEQKANRKGNKLGKIEQPVVFLGEPQPNFALLALHELGHALCKHKDYKVDVERIKIESEAWERAKTVLLHYENEQKSGWIDLPEWDDDFVQEKLDTYRDWLHVKSRCKKCGLTRYQAGDGKWHCPRCDTFML